ncbi:MAG: CPBP family intramembrane metalloprotease [Actinomycetota bacterium]|nr:CPBP family intramembrane metalloprotease [Actinomycetota bacterium]
MPDAEALDPNLERRPDFIPWGLSLAAGGYLGAVLLSSVAVVTWQSLVGTGGSGGIGVLTVSFLAEWCCFVAAALSGAQGAGRGLRAAFGLTLKLWPDVPLGLAVGTLFQLVVLPLVYLPIAPLVPHFAKRMSAPGRQLTSVAHHGPALVLLGVLIVVAAPTVEELFFRGLVLRSLEGHFGYPRAGARAEGRRGAGGDARRRRSGGAAGRWAAAVVSALLFGVAHVEPLQLLGLAAFGLALATMAQATGRLGPGIVAHAAFNATSFLALTHLH